MGGHILFVGRLGPSRKSQEKFKLLVTGVVLLAFRGLARYVFAPELLRIGARQVLGSTTWDKAYDFWARQ